MDVLRHPRITRDAIKKRKGGRQTSPTVRQSRKKGAAATPGRRPPSRTIRSVAEWEQWLEDYEDYPDEETELASGVKTGKRGK